jgi:uncharacterized protein YbjQ (UPF0145 family)
MATLRNLVGVEITEYATLQAETREMATRRTVEQAESMGSDAVVSVRYTTSISPQVHQKFSPTARP